MRKFQCLLSYIRYYIIFTIVTLNTNLSRKSLSPFTNVSTAVFSHLRTSVCHIMSYTNGSVSYKDGFIV